MVKHKVTGDGNLTVDGNLKHQIFFHRIFNGIPWYYINRLILLGI